MAIFSAPRRTVARNLAVALLVVGGITAAAMQLFGRSVADVTRTRVFIDKVTGQPFNVRITDNMTIPVPAPSGGNTGYPASFCYWTADGKIRKDPFPLLTNEQLGNDGPTFCPDCGRLVQPSVGPPGPDDKPPPKKGAEYEAYLADLRAKGMLINEQ